ncbi:MAG TPA: hypothetical protein VK559_07145 [Ferruginibacter sp.]|nr:hypothetical protein [Ferruginibacter sp.]
MKKPETYEQMMQQKYEINAFFDSRQNVHISIMRSVDKANNKLESLLNDFRHSLNDQLIALKYGKDYKASFLDEFLIQVNKL